jgi:hypothetical protein
MTESDWLTSTNPTEMINLIQTIRSGTLYQPPIHKSFYQVVERKASERLLRLFACACRRESPRSKNYLWEEDNGWGLMEKYPEKDVRPDGIPDGHPIPAIEHARLFIAGHIEETPSEIAADVARDVFGNPFQKQIQVLHRLFGEGTPVTSQDVLDTCFLTPQVKSLAEYAWSQRLESGELDNLTLLAVADALEEAGLPSEKIPPPRYLSEGGLLLDKEGWYTVKRCPVHPNFDGSYSPAGMKEHYAPSDQVFWDGSFRRPCDKCWSLYMKTASPFDLDRLARPHPILEHLRSTKKHWRGCFAIDVLTRRR